MCRKRPTAFTNRLPLLLRVAAASGVAPAPGAAAASAETGGVESWLGTVDAISDAFVSSVVTDFSSETTTSRGASVTAPAVASGTTTISFAGDADLGLRTIRWTWAETPGAGGGGGSAGTGLVGSAAATGAGEAG